MADLIIAGLFGGTIGYLAAIAFFRALYPVKTDHADDSDQLEQRYRKAEGGQ